MAYEPLTHGRMYGNMLRHAPFFVAGAAAVMFGLVSNNLYREAKGRFLNAANIAGQVRVERNVKVQGNENIAGLVRRQCGDGLAAEESKGIAYDALRRSGYVVPEPEKVNPWYTPLPNVPAGTALRMANCEDITKHLK